MLKTKELAKTIKHYIRCNGKYSKQKLALRFLIVISWLPYCWTLCSQDHDQFSLLLPLSDSKHITQWNFFFGSSDSGLLTALCDEAILMLKTPPVIALPWNIVCSWFSCTDEVDELAASWWCWKGGAPTGKWNAPRETSETSQFVDAVLERMFEMFSICRSRRLL